MWWRSPVSPEYPMSTAIPSISKARIKMLGPQSYSFTIPTIANGRGTRIWHPKSVPPQDTIAVTGTAIIDTQSEIVTNDTFAYCGITPRVMPSPY